MLKRALVILSEAKYLNLKSKILHRVQNDKGFLCALCFVLLSLMHYNSYSQDTLQSAIPLATLKVEQRLDTLLRLDMVSDTVKSLKQMPVRGCFKQTGERIKPLEWAPEISGRCFSSISKKRLTAVSIGTVGGYAAIMTAVGFSWYGNEQLGKFRWFADEKEWLQIDKTGHFFAPYFITTYGYNMLRWSGMKNAPAAITAGVFSFIAMSAVEVPDGLSVKYGASWSDLVFNFGGASLATAQYLIWKEQRITVKYSFHHVNYPVGELRDRAYDLYGEGFGERILKDYNGVTMWLSFNLYSFNHNIKPHWLNIAVGYAAGNLYGGFENKWTDKNGVYHDRSDLKRYRRFFLSLDADFTKFKAKTRGGKMVLGILNIIKLPMPAIEFNTLGQFVFHPMYFLNFDVPISVNMKRR